MATVGTIQASISEIPGKTVSTWAKWRNVGRTTIAK